MPRAWRSYYSSRLGSNMQKAGFRTLPDGWATHHIVSHNVQTADAKKARMILDNFSIDYDNWSNGVYLPQEIRGYKGYCHHRMLHSKHSVAYHKLLAKRLFYAKTKFNTETSVKRVLRNIARELRAGTFVNCTAEWIR